MASAVRFCCLALLVACMAAGALSVDPWMTLPDTPTLPTPASSGLLNVNGVQIWHALFSPELATSGPTVVFLHGGLGHSAYLGLQVTEVAKYRQVLSIDSRGHGRSSRNEQPYSYELMESDVIAVMDELSLTEVDVVGWSDGAIIGLVMARDHPARLHSLFAFAANSDPSGVLDVSTSPVFTSYIERAGTEYLQISPTPTTAAYDYFVGNISNMWATQPNLTASALAAMSSSTTKPIWIVDGDHEEAIKRSDTLFMADANPQFGLAILPRVSHFAFLQDHLTFTAHVFNWLLIDITPAAPQATTPTPTGDSSALLPSLFALVASLAIMTLGF